MSETLDGETLNDQFQKTLMLGRWKEFWENYPLKYLFVRLPDAALETSKLPTIEHPSKELFEVEGLYVVYRRVAPSEPVAPLWEAHWTNEPGGRPGREASMNEEAARKIRKETRRYWRAYFGRLEKLTLWDRLKLAARIVFKRHGK